ncbi:CLUMA_CG007553, isoform A [Clunio marinus]|uniref:CLUMA_CG007553, isoform A n=1 Tax=Clunio marinus TaxID=568069 RepID=A0A1J1I170_9DIPT|nr:CLUMA_CG007553, isoform A [Clunio marinus]
MNFFNFLLIFVFINVVCGDSIVEKCLVSNDLSFEDVRNFNDPSSRIEKDFQFCMERRHGQRNNDGTLSKDFNRKMYTYVLMMKFFNFLLIFVSVNAVIGDNLANIVSIQNKCLKSLNLKQKDLRSFGIPPSEIEKEYLYCMGVGMGMYNEDGTLSDNFNAIEQLPPQSVDIVWKNCKNIDSGANPANTAFEVAECISSIVG